MPRNNQSQRKPHKSQSKTETEKLPPHSDEAEKAVLSCIMISPNEVMPLCADKLNNGAFYDTRHKNLFNTLSEMFAARQSIDTVTVYQRLKDSNRLEDVGGFEYLQSVFSSAGTSALVGTYLAVVLEKYRLRRFIEVCTNVIRGIEVHESVNPEEVLWISHSNLANLLAEDTPEVSRSMSFAQAMYYDVAKDQNAVIGLAGNRHTRFLCKGHGCWLIGPSGIGKSSLTNQWAILLVLGMSFFGMQPVKPLRVLVVQAENDIGDAAEMIQGTAKALGINELSEQYDRIQTNFKVLTQQSYTKDVFCRWLGSEIKKFQADVVFADPFLSFAGIDVSRQDQCSQFLRNWLNPMLSETGAVMIGAHHTGKPKEMKGRIMTDLDYAYSGLGSSELVNWARAICVIIPLSDGVYKFAIPKRGERAGLVHPDNSPTKHIYMQHSQGRIFWEQVQPTEEADSELEPKEKKKSKVEQIVSANTHDVISKIPADGESAKSLAARFMAWALKKGISIGETNARTNLLAALASENVNKLRFDETSGRWFKGANA